MNNRFLILYSNLTRAQKIGLWIFVQFIVVVLLFSLVVVFMKDERPISINDGDMDVVRQIPDDIRSKLKDALWETIKVSVTDENGVKVDDVVIRDGSYEEFESQGIKTINFIVDIDSIKQTYLVSVGWGEKSNLEIYDNVVVSCPTREQMKYPEAICRGAYDNTNDLSLYVPYYISAPHNDNIRDIIIEGDEYSREINVLVSNCDSEGLKKQAQDYLDSIPVDLSRYKITYDVYIADNSYLYGMDDDEIKELNERCKW